MIIATAIISSAGDYYTVRPCPQLAYISKGLAESYPECAAYFDGSKPGQVAIVHADLNGRPAEIGAALGISFGMAIWLSLAIHAIGIEVYVCNIGTLLARILALTCFS
jgi:hypothetical protein